MNNNIKQLFQTVFDLNKRGVKASLVETNDEVRINLTSRMRRYQVRMLKISINDFEVSQTISFLNKFANQKEAA
jgi:hypothetical protein